MSKLDELITELCPDGVEYVSIGSVVNYEQPSKYIVTSTDYNDDFSIPVLTAGQSFILGYTNETENLYKASKENPVIIFDDFTGAFKWVDFPFKVKSSAMKMLTVDTEKTTLRYIFHIMGNIGLTSDEHKRLWISTYSTISIPLLPLPAQEEIVRILDNFTKLTAELTEELQKRREQYRHYSTMLFDGAKESGVHSIEEVCHIEKGKTPIQKAIPGRYPMVVTTTERKSCDTYQFDAKAVCVPLVSSRGHGVASLNHVYYQEGKFALGNILCAIIPKNEEQVYPKYLYYYFEQTKDYTLVPLMKGGANVALHMNDVEKVKVPIPSLEEQKHIVDILDRFETLCNDISVGLPAEIEARQNQYEYYLDKLLTFKELS